MQPIGRTQKLPKNCQLVYEVVCAQPPGIHRAAAQIFAEAKRRQARIGHSTVYRALERLRDTGLVHEVRVPGTASALYEPARHGHAHFLCTACGAVEDIDYAVPPTDLARLDAGHDIAIEAVSLTFNGRCGACRAR